MGNGGDSREASVRDLADLQGVPQDYLAKIFSAAQASEQIIPTTSLSD